VAALSSRATWCCCRSLPPTAIPQCFWMPTRSRSIAGKIGILSSASAFTAALAAIPPHGDDGRNRGMAQAHSRFPSRSGRQGPMLGRHGARAAPASDPIWQGIPRRGEERSCSASSSNSFAHRSVSSLCWSRSDCMKARISIGHGPSLTSKHLTSLSPIRGQQGFWGGRHDNGSGLDNGRSTPWRMAWTLWLRFFVPAYWQGFFKGFRELNQ
jgi:hypothetical protein